MVGEILQEIGFAGAGGGATGAGIFSGIGAGCVVAAASILYSKYEIENSIKTKKECSALMAEFDLEFDQIEKEESLNNEE